MNRFRWLNRVFVAKVQQGIEAAQEQAANADQPFDLAEDIKRMIAMGIVAFLLLIPLGIVTSMMSGGVRLMQDSGSKALDLIAARLHNPGS